MGTMHYSSEPQAARMSVAIAVTEYLYRKISKVRERRKLCHDFWVVFLFSSCFHNF